MKSVFQSVRNAPVCTRKWMGPYPIPARGLSFALIALIFLTSVELSCQGKAPDLNPPRAGEPAGLSTQSAYDSLHFQLVKNYEGLGAEGRRQLRETLKKMATGSVARLCPEEEPGAKLKLEGKLSGSDGKILAGIPIHIFQTDSQGYYAPTDAALGTMGETDPRLEGFLTTDAVGAFELHTIRPGSYPKPYQGRYIPQHIHFAVEAPGYESRNIQVVFDDDPAMSDEHWRKWAKELNFPIVKLIQSENGQVGNLSLVLKRYP